MEGADLREFIDEEEPMVLVLKGKVDEDNHMKIGIPKGVTKVKIFAIPI